MSILARRYHCILILADGRGKHFWSGEYWLKHFKSLNDAIHMTRGPYAKIIPEDGARLGLLRWNRNNIERWSLSIENGSKNGFMTSSIWCPADSTVDREQLGPDAYIDVARLSNSLFTESFLLCVAIDFVARDEFISLFIPFMKDLISQKESSVVLATERPWSKRPLDNIANQLSFFTLDINTALRKMQLLQVNELPGKWEVVDEFGS